MADTLTDLVNMAFAGCTPYAWDDPLRFDHGIACGWFRALRMERGDDGQIVTSLIDNQDRTTFACWKTT